MKEMLGLKGVGVRFKRFTLGPLDLSLDVGKVVGLIGPNGSGKTTTIRCIAGNLRYDSGTIDVCGRAARHDDGGWKQAIGYVPDRPEFYDHMRAGGYLAFVSRFYDKWSAAFAAELTARFRLDLDETVGRMSSGNRVKLALVAALAHKPQLALFDEPTAGLDPVVRTEVFGVLGELMEREEMTVLYSTHIIDDLHRLADELVLLMDGTIRMHEEKDALIDRWRQVFCHSEHDLSSVEGVMLYKRQGTLHELLTCDSEKVIAHLKESGVEHLRVQALTLEQIAVLIMKGK